MADWSCAKSLKPILRRRSGERTARAPNHCVFVQSGDCGLHICTIMYIKTLPKIPRKQEISTLPPCCPWSGANGRRFPPAPGRGGGLQFGVNQWFNRGSSVQPASLHPCTSPWNCCQIRPPAVRENRGKHAQRFTILFTLRPLHYPTLCESEIGSGRACGALGAEATCKLQSGQKVKLNPDTN